MGKLERIIANVPIEMATGMRTAVDSGAYASTDALVVDALAHWLAGAQAAELDLDALRALIAEGEQGDGMEAGAFFDQLDAEIVALADAASKTE